MWGEATEKQIEYAYAIADKLEIERPKTTYEECSNFISKYKERYKSLWCKDLITDLSKFNLKFYVNDFTEQERKWINDNLSDVAGVYAFVGEKNKILYIGKSLNLACRIPTSYEERAKQSKIKRVFCYATPTKADASILEMILITENKPVLNSDGNVDDYSLLFKSKLNILKDFKEVKSGRAQNVCKNNNRQ